MSYGIRLHIWGERACFTRPEMKGERVSYDVITPSAARGILSAIHWKPAIAWRVDRIHERVEVLLSMEKGIAFLKTSRFPHLKGLIHLIKQKSLFSHIILKSELDFADFFEGY